MKWNERTKLPWILHEKQLEADTDTNRQFHFSFLRKKCGRKRENCTFHQIHSGIYSNLTWKVQDIFVSSLLKILWIFKGSDDFIDFIFIANKKKQLMRLSNVSFSCLEVSIFSFSIRIEHRTELRASRCQNHVLRQ